MKPCDCVDQKSAKKLRDHGIIFGDYTVDVQFGMIAINICGHCTMSFPVSKFKKIAEWFLEDQMED